jgi:hypothetical protein
VTEEQEEKSRKRRTPEELRAHYQEKLKGLEEDEKRDVIRLLSGVHDDLVKISTYTAAKALTELTAILSAVRGALAKLGVK